MNWSVLTVRCIATSVLVLFEFHCNSMISYSNYCYSAQNIEWSNWNSEKWRDEKFKGSNWGVKIYGISRDSLWNPQLSSHFVRDKLTQCTAYRTEKIARDSCCAHAHHNLKQQYALCFLKHRSIKDIVGFFTYSLSSAGSRSHRLSETIYFYLFQLVHILTKWGYMLR